MHQGSHSASGFGSRGVEPPLTRAARLPTSLEATTQSCRTRCTCRAAPSRPDVRVAEEMGIQSSMDKALPSASGINTAQGVASEKEDTILDANLDGHWDIFADDFPLEEEESGLKNDNEDEKKNPTELIFKLDRRGYGWGEEIIPYVTIERRPIENKKRRLRNRSKGPNPWEEGSLEQFLLEMGVPKDQVEAVAAAATAWRVTPGGRPLIDRRRRSRVERNMWAVADYLMSFSSIFPGPEGIGSLLLTAPQILLAKPTQHDRWYRRVVELAGFMHHFGHCNVPEQWNQNPGLASWVKRQRTAKAEGELGQERLQILHALGFEFGEVAVITLEWENWFDVLVEWILRHSENDEELKWSGLGWFNEGGWKAGELAVWAELQRELRLRNLLPKEAIRRLNAVNFCWEPETTKSNLEWMSHFRKLVYITERSRMKRRRRSAYSPGDIMIPSETTNVPSSLDAFTSLDCKAAEGRNRDPQATRASSHEFKWPKMDRLSSVKLDLRMQHWLSKQRLLWRAGRLPKEKIALFWTARIDLNDYSRHAWLQLAYETASFVNGFDEKWSKVLSRDAEMQEKGPQLSPRLYVRPEDVVAVTKDGNVIERPVKLLVTSLSDRQSALVNSIHGLQVDGMLEDDLRVQLTLNDRAEGLVNQSDGKSTGQRKAPGADEVRRRLKTRRWILTQQAMFEESRLSAQESRHIVFLGLDWLLSKKDTNEANEEWMESYRELAELVRKHGAISTDLPWQMHEWVDRQRGLRRLGMLNSDRIQLLNELGMDWEFQKSDEDHVWDQRLMELLEFKRVHSHLKVPQNEVLGSWLAQQLAEWGAGELLPSRMNQLTALGISAQHL